MHAQYHMHVAVSEVPAAPGRMVIHVLMLISIPLAIAVCAQGNMAALLLPMARKTRDARTGELSVVDESIQLPAMIGGTLEHLKRVWATSHIDMNELLIHSMKDNECIERVKILLAHPTRHCDINAPVMHAGMTPLQSTYWSAQHVATNTGEGTQTWNTCACHAYAIDV
jgi:hypothetical protein